MDIKLIELLACPNCKTQPLSLKNYDMDKNVVVEGELNCYACGKSYQINKGTPIMLPDGLNLDLSAKDESWHRWNDKLKKFLEWRTSNQNNSERSNKLDNYANDLTQKFVEFCKLKDSSEKILDIGCGQGIHEYLGEGVYYIGVDPIVIEASFPIVKAVGEYLPFRDETFGEVIIMQALDHCQSAKNLIGEVSRVLSNGGAINIQQTLVLRKSPIYKILGMIKSKIKLILGYKTLDCKMSYLTNKELIRMLEDQFGDIQTKTLHPHIFIKAVKLDKEK